MAASNQIEQGVQGPATIDGREVDAFSWLSFAFPFDFTGRPAAPWQDRWPPVLAEAGA